MSIAAGKCANAEFSPKEMRQYKREFQYQGYKLWSLLNSLGYQTINIRIDLYLFTFHLPRITPNCTRLQYSRGLIQYYSATQLHKTTIYRTEAKKSICVEGHLGTHIYQIICHSHQMRLLHDILVFMVDCTDILQICCMYCLRHFCTNKSEDIWQINCRLVLILCNGFVTIKTSQSI